MNIKTIIILIVLIIIVAVGWLWYGSSDQQPSIQTPAESQPYVSADAGLTTSASDASDAALENDLNAVGSQMNSLNTDASNIDRTLNAQ